MISRVVDNFSFFSLGVEKCDQIAVILGRSSLDLYYSFALILI